MKSNVNCGVMWNMESCGLCMEPCGLWSNVECGVMWTGE